MSIVACQPSTRTVVVGSSPDARYPTIQAALDAAVPGDLILVRGGTYVEPVSMHRSGTPSAPITLKAYPGETPSIRPNEPVRAAYVGLEGSWLVLDGFEIHGGRHGVVVRGSHNVIRNSTIHDNGVGCPDEMCGQGILVASASDVVIEHNRIHANGLATISPWHAHGIYLSSHYGPAPARISVSDNVIGGHAGAGLHVWDATAVAGTLLVQGNLFEDNAIELVLTRVLDVLVKGNQIRHDSHPPTDAPRSTMLWFDGARNVAIEANTFDYAPTAVGGVPSLPIHYYVTDQDARELRWRLNTWRAQGTAITDALLNAAAPPGSGPRRPLLVAERLAANPVSFSWAAGAGATPDDYVLLASTAPGAAPIAAFGMGALAAFSAIAPEGTQWYVRVVSRNPSGAAESNEVTFVVARAIRPTGLSASIAGRTVHLTWTSGASATGATVLARYATSGPVIAALPVRQGTSTLTVTQVPPGTYFVSVAGHGAGATEESETVRVVVAP